MKPSAGELTPYQERWRALFNASPYIQLLGMDLKELGGGRSRLELQTAQRHTNLQGQIQGGVIATLIDSGMSSAIRGLLPDARQTVTVEMKLNFLAAVQPGDTLISEGEVLKLGRQLAVVRATIRTAGGTAVAAGQGTFMLLRGRSD